MQEDAVQEQNKQTKRHSVSSGLSGQSEPDCINERRGRTPAGTFPLWHQSGPRRRTQSIAPTSSVPALNWKHDRHLGPLMFSEKNLMPVSVAFVQRTATPAATAGPKD